MLFNWSGRLETMRILRSCLFPYQDGNLVVNIYDAKFVDDDGCFKIYYGMFIIKVRK